MKTIFSTLALSIIGLLSFSTIAAPSALDSKEYCLLVIVNPKDNSTFKIYALQENRTLA